MPLPTMMYYFVIVIAICLLHLVSAQPTLQQQQRGLEPCGANCDACDLDGCTLCSVGYKLNGSGGCDACTCDQDLPSLECRACRGCWSDSDPDVCYSCAEKYGEGCTSCTSIQCSNCPADSNGEEQGIDEEGSCTPCPDYGTPQRIRISKAQVVYRCETQETEYGFTDFYNPDEGKKRCCQRCDDSNRKSRCNAIPTTKSGARNCQWVKKKQQKAACVPNDTCESYSAKGDCKDTVQCQWTKQIGSSSRRCYQKCDYAVIDIPPNCKKAFCVDRTLDGSASCEKCNSGYQVCRDADDRGQCVEEDKDCP